MFQLLAVPIVIQDYFNAAFAYSLNCAPAAEWCVAGPSALVGAVMFTSRAHCALLPALVRARMSEGHGWWRQGLVVSTFGITQMLA